MGISWDANSEVLWDDDEEMARVRAQVAETNRFDHYGRDTWNPGEDFEQVEATVAGLDDYLVHNGRVIGFREAVKLVDKYYTIADLESGDREKQRRALVDTLKWSDDKYVDRVAEETLQRIGPDRASALLQQFEADRS